MVDLGPRVLIPIALSYDELRAHLFLYALAQLEAKREEVASPRTVEGCKVACSGGREREPVTLSDKSSFYIWVLGTDCVIIIHNLNCVT